MLIENYSIIIILVTLVCSAFFSGSEIAFLQANKLKIEIDRKQGNFNAKILSSFVKHQSKFITTQPKKSTTQLKVRGVGLHGEALRLGTLW